MSEQEEARVNRFLDDLDDRRNKGIADQGRRQARLDVPKWEYMVWRVEDRGTVDAQINAIDGVEVPEPRRGYFYERLKAAGAVGWDIVDIERVGVFRTFLFKRPLVES
jgi:hypothetical protein